MLEETCTMHNREALHQKVGKANFDLIYNLEDPREYFNTLGQFDYCIPQHGQRLFSELIEARRDASRNGDGAQRFRVVDVCCSYGINATLLKYETTLEEMYARYGSGELTGLSSEELAEDDAAFYGARRREASPEFVGLDVAHNAVSYGLRSGILDAGFAENLEEDEPTEALSRAVAGADLLTITGGIGYVTERTFERLLDRMVEGADGRMPWVAAFALRWVSYDRISEVLSDYGLVTEKLAGRTFTQRRFTDAAEQEYVLEELTKMGVDTTSKEDAGWYHANFYLSRPAEEAKIPSEALLRKS
jgi:hypothetical protein